MWSFQGIYSVSFIVETLFFVHSKVTNLKLKTKEGKNLFIKNRNGA